MSRAGPFRLAGTAGAAVDPARPLGFSFDGRPLTGLAGDSLASALLANGVRLVGRSFKYHRPRGILAAGSEEPNALVTLGAGARALPNTRATVVELHDGLEAASQNRLGSLRFDLLGLLDLLAPFIGAGFYYKTFMAPGWAWERLWEPLIRRSAGLGALSGRADPDVCDHGWRHCDLLVIGAGPAGLAAALRAARAGARVIVADEDWLPGGRLNAERLEVEGRPGALWAAEAAAELAAHPKVRLMPRSTVFGLFDGGSYGVLERSGPHTGTPGRARAVLWRIHARRAILAAGATERLIAFAGNDRPGVMLAGAVRADLNRWAVACGRRVAVLTNNDDGWRTAADLAARGVRPAALIDLRKDAAPMAAPAGVEVIRGVPVVATAGRHGLRAITLADGRRIRADCLAVAGGWSPNLQLALHLGARPRWDGARAAFLPPAELPPGLAVAGAAAGESGLGAALRSGHAAAGAALEALGLSAPETPAPRAEDEPDRAAPIFHLGGGRGRAFVDLQNDVTAKDIRQAVREGYDHPEHAKRYTTLGMATDQGRTGMLAAMAVLAEASGRPLERLALPAARPPFTPVPVAALAGPGRGQAYRPERRTPAHGWAAAAGAVFTDAGAWKRAQWFPRPGETTWRQSVDREVLATRGAVGVCDVSTLGKIEIRGADGNAFLDRVYAGSFATLPVGRVRYGLMLREDGFVLDDGTTARLGETQWVMTTTTAKAGAVLEHLEFCRQCLWPELDVTLVPVTDAWAQVSVAGPQARAVLDALFEGAVDFAPEAFPFMTCAALTHRGVPVRLFRVSFSGELAWEIAVPARYGAALMARLAALAEAEGGCVYGTEALGVMRIEKGHAAGPELNGQTAAQHLGMGAMLSRPKDAVGRVLARRPGIDRPDGPRLVGLIPVDRRTLVRAGAHLVAPDAAAVTANDLGHVTSACWSPTLGHPIALALLEDGARRHGQRLRAVDPVRGVEVAVEVVAPHFVDPEGGRQRG
ncbi:MAG: sarcosine oxidase subunit alpha family protein [Alphaproteobacteria bacterium]|nr:MAG: sarcosine oxidase subunit alpha family protein [Alphaproteobacteria bacterium]